jgi:uncharacterized protein YjaZ
VHVNILQQNSIKWFVLHIVAVLFFVGCTSKNRWDIDVPNTTVNIEFKRMDKALFSANRTQKEIIATHFSLLEEYPETYQLFVEQMLMEGNVYDTLTAARMASFVSNKDMNDVYNAIQNSFPNNAFFEEEFTTAFKYYTHYFPNENIPNIVGYYSNFNAKTLLLDSSIAIGLELYLGKEHPIIESLSAQSIPQYLKNKMQPEFLVSDALKFLLLSKYYRDMGNDFLSTIVSMGKIMYLLDALQPKVEDWKKMGYTKSQLEWCTDNEEQVWKYIVEQQLLFSTSQEKINHFIDEGPFTKGLPQESPSMVGIWIGWQIVRDYMNENKDVSLQQLIDETDSKKILKYYQPN